KSWASIACGSARFRLAGLDAADFPAIPAPASKGVAIAGADLLALIERVEFAVAESDARYYLAGSRFEIGPESIAMVATDGHRLALARRPGRFSVKEPLVNLVPRKLLRELVRLLGKNDTVHFAPTDSQIAFWTDDWTLLSRTVAGTFPDYMKLLA